MSTTNSNTYTTTQTHEKKVYEIHEKKCSTQYGHVVYIEHVRKISENDDITNMSKNHYYGITGRFNFIIHADDITLFRNIFEFVDHHYDEQVEKTMRECLDRDVLDNKDINVSLLTIIDENANTWVNE
jgi:hypothetical protein